MGVLIFILLMVICMGLVYLIHKYFGKSEFYLLTIIYSIISLMLSFKIVKIFGVDINIGIIFSSSLIIILYYFVNKYGKDDAKKIIITMIVSTVSCIIFLLQSCLMISSLYDTMSSLYQNMILNNLPILILYPISLISTLLLSNYCFEELKNVTVRKNIKSILTIVGIMFIDTFIFIYFSYAFIIKFNVAMEIAITNLVFKSIIIIIYFFIINKIIKVRKVK